MGPKQAMRNAINAAARGQVYIAPSGYEVKTYTPLDANMTDITTGLSVVGRKSEQQKERERKRERKSPNIFKRTLKNIFRAFIN